jgi:hypothetical protein
VIGKNRIMIYGPQDDGTYVVEFGTGDILATSIPNVIRHFQDGFFVPEVHIDAWQNWPAAGARL